MVDASKIDYEELEKQDFSYTLTVGAIDMPDTGRVNVGKATVVVEVLPVNEFYPKWTSPKLQANSFSFEDKAILMHDPVGTIVETFRAKDDDKGKDGTVTYRIISVKSDKGEDVGNHFFMDMYSGQLKKASHFDIKAVSSSFDITVQAIDGGSSPKSVNGKLKVSLGFDSAVGAGAGRVVGMGGAGMGGARMGGAVMGGAVIRGTGAGEAAGMGGAGRAGAGGAVGMGGAGRAGAGGAVGMGGAGRAGAGEAVGMGVGGGSGAGGVVGMGGAGGSGAGGVVGMGGAGMGDAGMGGAVMGGAGMGGAVMGGAGMGGAGMGGAGMGGAGMGGAGGSGAGGALGIGDAGKGVGGGAGAGAGGEARMRGGMSGSLGVGSGRIGGAGVVDGGGAGASGAAEMGKGMRAGSGIDKGRFNDMGSDSVSGKGGDGRFGGHRGQGEIVGIEKKTGTGTVRGAGEAGGNCDNGGSGCFRGTDKPRDGLGRSVHICSTVASHRNNEIWALRGGYGLLLFLGALGSLAVMWKIKKKTIAVTPASTANGLGLHDCPGLAEFKAPAPIDTHR
ncbi:glycine-rich cell wall structural protein 1-like [Haliotis rufescens]|uniref:glycine-rich cell wall structural protein 1-like n=1 Tax=Haliotis rufescens TaxID=6454 RepID=UPI00201E917A|nr:glycine-rich cell wall structural protein 1-like [Haliotis rufescens]